MPHQLSYAVLHDYSAASAIMIPARLRSGSLTAFADAYLDTGSTFCVFKRDYADVLGLELEAGDPLRIRAVTGSFTAYGHALTLETLGLEFETIVYFAAHEGFARNVLGRHGWLDQVRIGLVEHEGKLYVSRYDEELE